MVVVVSAESLTDAWLDDLEYLHKNGREHLNLVTTIADPDPRRMDDQIVTELDARLTRRRKQRVATVANTIFPAAFARGTGDRQEFYGRYLSSYPRIRRLKGNKGGTYFGRLIEYPASRDVKRGPAMNQVERIIAKLQTQRRGDRPKRFAYQAQVFIPGRDDGSTMGFPCLSFISFQLDGDRLCMTAMYRNQYYFQRALGNFVGLARLQRFVAQEVGLSQGSLTIHACNATIDVIGLQETEELIRLCRRTGLAAIAA